MPCRGPQGPAQLGLCSQALRCAPALLGHQCLFSGPLSLFKKCLFILLEGVGEGRIEGRERIPSRLCAIRGARCGARTHELRGGESDAQPTESPRCSSGPLFPVFPLIVPGLSATSPILRPSIPGSSFWAPCLHSVKQGLDSNRLPRGEVAVWPGTRSPEICSFPYVPVGPFSLSLSSDHLLHIFSHLENGLAPSHPQLISGSWLAQIRLRLSPTLFATSDCPEDKVQTSQLTVGPSGFASLAYRHCEQRLHLPAPLWTFVYAGPCAGNALLLAFLLKLVILSDLGTTTLCLPIQASPFLCLRASPPLCTSPLEPRVAFGVTMRSSTASCNKSVWRE